MFGKYKRVKEIFVKDDNSEGFSLLEIVVSVGILLVLTVGGLLSYGTITDNARQAATNKTASELHTYMMDHFVNNDDVSVEEALENWAKSSDKFSNAKIAPVDTENKNYLIIDDYADPTYRIVLYTSEGPIMIDDRTVQVNGAYVEVWDAYSHSIIDNGEMSQRTFVAERG